VQNVRWLGLLVIHSFCLYMKLAAPSENGFCSSIIIDLYLSISITRYQNIYTLNINLNIRDIHLVLNTSTPLNMTGGFAAFPRGRKSSIVRATQ
jgi:hypothetical protein